MDNIEATQGEAAVSDKLVMWVNEVEPHTAYQGGWYYRSEITDFVKKLKDSGHEVVGLAIDDTYNIEFITKEIK